MRVLLSVLLAAMTLLAVAPSARADWRLDVGLGGSGNGSVTVSVMLQAGTCPGMCSFAGGSSTTATLVPVATPGSILEGWSGCTTLSGNNCTVTLVSAPDSCCPLTPHVAVYSVTAMFAPSPPQVPQEGYCVPTVERGWTFAQLAVDQPTRDPYWATIFGSRIPVVLGGHLVTPTGAPVILAALVPGVGLTCDQPYVPYPPGSPYGAAARPA